MIPEAPRIAPGDSGVCWGVEGHPPADAAARDRERFNVGGGRRPDNSDHPPRGKVLCALALTRGKGKKRRREPSPWTGQHHIGNAKAPRRQDAGSPRAPWSREWHQTDRVRVRTSTVGSRGRHRQSQCQCGCPGTGQYVIAVLCSIASVRNYHSVAIPPSRHPAGQNGFETEEWVGF